MAANFGEKSRVAHRATPASSMMQQTLEHKRLALAKIAETVNNKKLTPKFDLMSKSRGQPKKRKKADDSEEEDFILPDDESEAEDNEFLSDEEDDAPKKKKRPPPPKKVSPIKSNGLTTAPKERRLSESTDDDEWLEKPTPAKVMKTKAEAPPKPQRRKIVLSDESDEDAPMATATLKNVVKSAEIHRRKNGNNEFSSGEEEEGVAEIDDDDRGADTPSDDSDAEERKSNRRRESEDPLSRKAREFFNAATKQELLATPRVTDKIAQCIISKRPFETYAELEDALKEVSRGTGALEAYIEHLENRDVLERILDDCKEHAEAVAADFEKCSENKRQPVSLAPGYSLHDYQLVGLNWLIMMYDKGFNCILGDEMGLGKTIQVISFLAHLKEQKVSGPHLVVVPSSTIENWMGEMARWCPSLKLMTYYGSQDDRKQLRHMAKKKKDSIDVVLTTYNMISSKHDDKKFFKNFSMNYIIYDEGHLLKNCSTERYRNLMKVKGKRKILLTGTPLQNNLIELISLMYFVMTKVFTNYCDDITQLLTHFKQQGPALDSSSSTSMYQKDRIEQAKQILQPYILRRLKSQVLGHLPDKKEKVIEVEMIEEQQDLYDSVVDSCRGIDGDPSNAYGALVRLRQAANHPLLRRVHFDDLTLDKVAKTLCAKEKPYETKKWEHVSEDLSYLSDFQLHQLCEKYSSTQKFLLCEDLALKSGKCEMLDTLLPEIKAKGDKLLIFSQFTSMLDILEVYLRVRGHSYKRLDGSTPVMERQEMINEFNVDSELFVFLLSTRAGGLGINLTSANHIILHDIDFNPYNDKQAEDRCHRMGQKKEVFVTRLITKDSVEEGMHALARKKLQLEKAVTDGIKGQLDDEDTRDSSGSGSKEEKVDAETLKVLLSSALTKKR